MAGVGFRRFVGARASAILTAGLLGFAHVAGAADVAMPVKAIPRVVPSWAGCYVGAQLGVAMSQSDWNYTNNNPYTATGNEGPQLIPGASFDQDRGVIGTQLGCNFVVSGPWVMGVEAGWITNPMNKAQDANFSPFPVVPGTPVFNQSITTNIQSIVSLTGRIGYAFIPDWLFYFKGGYAGANIETSGSLRPSAQGFDWNDSQWHHGWTAGGGFEYRLFRNVTVGAEYSYYRFGSENHSGQTYGLDFLSNGTTAPSNPVNHSVSADVHTVMARINFGTGNGGGSDAASAFASSRFEGTFSAFMDTAAKYSSWNGSRGSNIFSPAAGSGQQVYTPTLIGIDYAHPDTVKLETRIKSGWVYANQSTQGQQGTYDGPVDTQASINATFLNFDSVRPQVGVAVNLPTGTAYLPNNQRFARMDPDLVEVGSYGAGFNINPTAGFVMGINQNTAMSFSAGYAWQGAFTREGVDLNFGGAGSFGAFDLKRKVDPGDVFTGNVNYTTEIGPLVVLATFAYMSESEVKTDGVSVGQAGARYVSNLTLNQRLTDQWNLAINGSLSYQEKNKINVGGSLVAEPKNSNSVVVIGSFEPTYQWSERLKVAANYSVLWRNENYYDQIEEQFIPAKLKNTVGMSATYSLTPSASIEMKGSHSWITQDTGPFLPVVLVPLTLASLPPTLSYTAWMASLSANLRF